MGREAFFTARAIADLDEALAFYSEQSIPLAQRWCDAVERAIESLESGVIGFATAREADLMELGLRQIKFGVGRRLTHRMVFAERDDRIVVYTVRHLARSQMSIDDLV